MLRVYPGKLDIRIDSVVIIVAFISGRVLVCAAAAIVVVAYIVRPCSLWSIGMLRVYRGKLDTRVDGVVIVVMLCLVCGCSVSVGFSPSGA